MNGWTVLAVGLFIGTVAAAADTGVATNTAAPPEPTIVTAESLQVDYQNNVGTFTGNVLVIDPRITVRADRMIVQFGAAPLDSGTNALHRTLQKIEAHGGVVITAEDKKAVADHAEYTAADGKVVLTGNPQVDGPDGVVSGSKITFWRDQKKMDVESATRLILFPEESKSAPVP